jgi:uncharacterized protein YciI
VTLFAIVAYDKLDAEAPARRKVARTEHFQRMKKAVEASRIHFAGSMLHDGVMTCSIIVVDFPNREELNAWIEEEPYLKSGAWHDINVAPLFVAVQNGAITETWLEAMARHTVSEGAKPA